MAENEAKETKEFNARKWIIWTIIISVIIVVGTAIFLIVTYFKDDSNRSLIEYIEQGIVILLAVAGGCFSIISMINGKKNNEEQQRREDALRNEQRVREDKLLQQQKEFEEKWNQKKIDADLKASARIEWIQDVRKATSKFIAACYGFIRLENDFNQEVLHDIEETGLLLILYFGPDKSGNNNEIVKVVNTILEAIQLLAKGEKGLKDYDKLSKLGEEGLKNLDNDLKKVQKQFEQLLKELNEMIRKYLKTEWDRAKNNED